MLKNEHLIPMRIRRGVIAVVFRSVLCMVLNNVCPLTVLFLVDHYYCDGDVMETITQKPISLNPSILLPSPSLGSSLYVKIC